MGAIVLQEELLLVAPVGLSRCAGQPRRIFDEAKLIDLADSIGELGQELPVTARRRADGSLQIITGERRWRAGKLLVAGYLSPNRRGEVAPDRDFKLKVLVSEADVEGGKLLARQLAENAQRADMSYLEEAEAFARLRDEFDFSPNAISNLGFAKGHVYRRLALVRLPMAWRERLENGDFPLWVFSEALRVPDETVSKVAGVTALEDALQVCSECRNKGEAEEVMHRRYLGPMRESVAWQGMSEERERVFWDFVEESLTARPTEDFTVASYAVCRRLFPFGVGGLLLPGNAENFVLAEEMAPGVGALWGELAAVYNVPMMLAYDAAGAVRILVNRGFLSEAMELARPVSGDGALDDSAAGMPSVRDDAEAHHSPPGDAAGDVATVSEADALEEGMRVLLGALDARIRVVVEESGLSVAGGEVFHMACLFVAEAGTVGLRPEEHPSVGLCELLGIGGARPGRPLFERWSGFYDEQGFAVCEQGAVVSFMVCNRVFYRLRVWDGALTSCPEWVEVAEVFGVVLDGEEAG